MTNTNRELIKALVWAEVIIAMFIATLILAMMDSFHVFTMFFITSFAIFGFSFTVCDEEKGEGQQ